MIANPAYEELLFKVNELEKEIASSKLVEVALKKSEEFSSSLLTHSPTAIKDKYGNITEFVGVTKDITKRREIEEALRKAHNDLENRVRERTTDLQKANEDLNVKTKNQEDLNTALRVLLENREKDKKQNEDKILLNVKELLIPYLYKLKNSSLT
jgi:C4-dicarboxylate-specific signal transduction histidine kinase